MADPLNSGDDVSAIVRFEAGRCLCTDIPSFSDLRKTQERRGSKATGGEDETCKRQRASTVPEGSAAVGGAGDSSLSFYPLLKRAIGGMVEFVLTSCTDSRQLYTTYYHILNTHPQCNEHTERLS